MKTYVIDRGCKLCDACFWVCLAGAIEIKDDCAEIDQAKCTHCGQCYDSCANEAISIHEGSEVHG